MSKFPRAPTFLPLSLLTALPRLVVVAVFAVTLGLLTLSGPGGASAAAPSASYQWLTGTGFICEPPVSAPCPTTAMAANGDTIDIRGEGTLSVHPKSVTGGGTFTHHMTDGGSITGTWTAVSLLAFKDFGQDAALGLPLEFRGGHALMLIQLSVGGTPVHTGVLTIDCDLGTSPHGHPEGVRLAVQGGLNFNQKVEGADIFVRQ